MEEELEKVCRNAWDTLDEASRLVLIQFGVIDPMSLIDELRKENSGPIRTLRGQVLGEKERAAYGEFLYRLVSEMRKVRPTTKIYIPAEYLERIV